LPLFAPLNLLKPFFNDLLKAIQLHKRNIRAFFYQLCSNISIYTDFVVKTGPIQKNVSAHALSQHSPLRLMLCNIP